MAEPTKKTAAEVGVKLVVDSNAKAVGDEVSKGLSGIGAHAKRLTKNLDLSAKSNLTALKGLALGAGSLATAATLAAGGALVGFAFKSAHAFMESQAQVKQLASTLTMIDQKGNAFLKIKEYAGELKDELEDLAIQTGVADDVAVQTFDNLIERGGKTVDQAKELTEQMIFAGRAFQGGPEALSQGFQMLEMGMVRARNPLVQLISTTGTLKGSAKSVAKELQKMPIDKQMELAEKAIGKMAGKMKDVPMTLGELKTSIGVAAENVFEDAGKPIVQSLKPAVAKVRELFLGNKDAILGMASQLGVGLGKAMEIVLPLIDEVSNAIRANWKEIQSAFEAFAGPGRELFEYIYEHKGEFAKTIGDVVSVFLKVTVFLIKAAAAIRDAVLAAAKFVGRQAAFVATGGESTKFFAQEDQLAQTKAMQARIKEKGGLSNEEFEKAQAQYVKTAIEGGMNAADAQRDFTEQWRRAVADHQAVMDQVSVARDAAMTDDVQRFAMAFGVAKGANDKAAMQYVAAFLKDNLALQNALAKAGPEIFKGGFDAFIDTLTQLGNKDAAAALKKAARPDLGISPKMNLTQNFNGAITIKQDFRDEDPDRVAAVFREDMARYGTSRIQSRFAQPFGF